METAGIGYSLRRGQCLDQTEAEKATQRQHGELTIGGCALATLAMRQAGRCPRRAIHRKLAASMVGQIDPSTGLQHALAQHQSGDVAGAVARYRQLLPLLPDHPFLFFLLGTALSQLGQCDEGLIWFDRSLSLTPDQPMVLSNRGNALRLLKRYDEALADYDRAVALSPGYAEAHFNRGIALADLKRFEDAVASFSRAIALVPDYAEAYVNRGNAFAALRRPAEALADFDRTLARAPQHAMACHGRGRALVDLGRTDEAIASFGRAIAIDPGYTDAYINRGGALQKVGRFAEALADCDRAVALDPSRAEAHSNRGCVLAKLDRYDDALASYDRAIAAQPSHADAHCNRGCALRYLGRSDEALASFGRAIATDPDHADAHMNIATLALALGDFTRGWPEYEWRWKLAANRVPPRNFSQPLWVGQPLAGKTLLVHAEQGYGDAVMACRYIPMAAALGATVVVETPKRLLPLLQTLGDYRFIATGEALPPFDLHCPIMSLPRAFDTRLETIPAAVPYLFAAPRTLSAVAPRVGLVWSGNRQHSSDADRSIALRQLAPILRLPLAFHALQIDIRPDDAAALSDFSQLELHRHDQNDFGDAAALIAAMDLVVSVDTAVAHIAGALAKPVWILLPWLADWRWLEQRRDSPWYPTARLFRQSASGDWDSVIADVAAELPRRFA